MNRYDQITSHFQWWEFESWEIGADGKKHRVAVPFELLTNVRLLCLELEVLRAWLGGPKIHVISGYRTLQHNEHCYRKERAAGDLVVGTKSRHRKGKAADIRVEGVTPKQVNAAIEDLIELKKMCDGGLGLYRDFNHYDVGHAGRRW